jgi:signal transduction histidine kinase/ActR/RegA family two-component response regulator
MARASLDNRDRVLLLAFPAMEEMLALIVETAGFIACPCRSAVQAVATVQTGAAVLIITAELLTPADITTIELWATQQPLWSHLPIILLARDPDSPAMLAMTERLGNVVLLPEACPPPRLRLAIKSAWKGRQRQYDVAAGLSATGGAVDSPPQNQKLEAIGQLTGGIAHDFNNLLGAVLGNLELLHSRLSDPKLLRFVENALQAVNRGARLTAQLLAFSRQRAVSLQPVDINALVKGLDELLSHTLGGGIVVKTALAPNLPPAQADSNQLELAILNLAINASDAMQHAGTLTIHTRLLARVLPGDPQRAAPAIAIAVTDTGCGMPPDILDRVFEPFFTTKEIGKGTGLGLSQVQETVRQSGGLVEIASQPGQGTTVTILLPQADATAQPVPAAQGPELLATGQNQLVLVLDDDAAIGSFLADSLKMLGYRALVAANGMAALGLLATEQPAAAIVDYAMPGMNGADWVRQARRTQPALPIVFATGHPQPDLLQAACPEAPLLRKPFQIAALAQALDQALQPPASAAEASQSSDRSA